MQLTILAVIYFALALVSGFLIRADVEKQGVYVKGVGPNGWLVACIGAWLFAFVFPVTVGGIGGGQGGSGLVAFVWVLGFCLPMSVCLTYLFSRGDAKRRSETDAATHQWPVGR